MRYGCIDNTLDLSISNKSQAGIIKYWELDIFLIEAKALS